RDAGGHQRPGGSREILLGREEFGRRGGRERRVLFLRAGRGEPDQPPGHRPQGAPMTPGGANGGVEREGGITMTGTMAEVLPEVPMTDNEVGVEIIFLEPDQEPAGEAAMSA